MCLRMCWVVVLLLSVMLWAYLWCVVCVVGVLLVCCWCVVGVSINLSHFLLFSCGSFSAVKKNKKQKQKKKKKKIQFSLPQ